MLVLREMLRTLVLRRRELLVVSVIFPLYTHTHRAELEICPPSPMSKLPLLMPQGGEHSRFDLLTMVLSYTPTSFPDPGFSEAHLIYAPSLWIHLHLPSDFSSFLSYCIRVATLSPFHTLMNLSLAKSPLCHAPLNSVYDVSACILILLLLLSELHSSLFAFKNEC